MPDAATQAMSGLTASGTSAASMVAGAAAALGVLALAKSCVSGTTELTTAEPDSLAAWQAQKALGALPPDAVAAQQWRQHETTKHPSPRVSPAVSPRASRVREFGLETPTKTRPPSSPTLAADVRSASPPTSPLEEPPSARFRPFEITPDQPLVCCIDGAIGAGKTTLIELVRAGLCARGYNAVVVQEPVKEWERVGILQEFYEHGSSPTPGLVAYDFQTYTFVTRVEECVKMAEENPTATVFLLERSVLTDRFVFMEMQRELCGPRRMEMYEKWWAMWSRIMPWEPTKMVYLKPTLDKCMERVFKRGREGEVKEDDVAEEEGEDGFTELLSKPAAGAGLEDVEEGVEEEDDSGGDGVLGAYQARLCRAHDCYLLGQHADEFPLMPYVDLPTASNLHPQALLSGTSMSDRESL